MNTDKWKLLIVTLFFSLESFALCTVSATSINFGAYDVFNPANSDSTGQMTINGCVANKTSVVISLNGGIYGNVNQRQMQRAGSSTRLLYNLYTDSSRTTIWGDTSGGNTVSQVVLRGMTVNVPVYGRVTALQDVDVGTYTDSVTVTITF